MAGKPPSTRDPSSLHLLSAACLLLLGLASAAHAYVLEPGFGETVWWPGFSGTATGMAWAPDGSNRLFVATQSGVIWIIAHPKPGEVPSPSAYQQVPFAVVSPTFNNVETGLIGIAFDPDFQINHYLYAFVTVSPKEQQILRLTADGDTAINVTPLVTGLPTLGERHNGGAIGVGADRKLYWGVGDNDAFLGVDTDLSSLAAKIGRANFDGTAPNDNPFFDGNGPNADYIWARGVRNPFSLTFQPETGAMWLDVVGESYEQTFVVHAGDHAGYQKYENNQPPGYIAPVITYRTNNSDTLELVADGAVRGNGVVTFTTTMAHGFRRGEKITIANVGDSSFAGDVYVSDTPSSTSFTALQAGPDATSGGGTATTQQYGGCLLGGTFYDATLFPSTYRGNYFVGDFNEGAILRAKLTDPNAIAQVDRWEQFSYGDPIVDIEPGPDGALYVLFTTGEIVRTSYVASVQALVLSNLHVWMSQGSERSISVSLSVQPAADVIVQAARTTGDPHIDVGPSELTFSPSNWNVPQRLTIVTAADAASALDSANIEISAAGLAPETVIVNAVDDPRNELVLSAGALPIAEGSTSSFTVALAKQPAASLAVNIVRSAGSPNVTVSGNTTLLFTPENFASPQTVTIDAFDDSVANHDTAMLTLTAAGLPTREVRITVEDNDPYAPTITSLPSKSSEVAGVGIVFRYQVTATGVPTPTFQLESGPEGMSIDPATGVLTWTPTTLGAVQATVVATNGVTPDARQDLTVVVVGPPHCAIGTPTAGDSVSGTQAQVCGEGYPEEGSAARVVRVEYSIDTQWVYAEDTASYVRVCLGGNNASWDTTALPDGVHMLGLRVTDILGQSCETVISVTIANAVSDGGTRFDAGSGSPRGVDAGYDAAIVRTPGMDAGPLTDAATRLEPDAGLRFDAGREAVIGSTPGVDGGSSMDAASATMDGALSAGSGASFDGASGPRVDAAASVQLQHDGGVGNISPIAAGQRREATAARLKSPSGCRCGAVASTASPSWQWSLLVFLATAQRLRRHFKRRVGREKSRLLSKI